MKKTNISRYTTRAIPQFLIQSITMIVTAIGAFMFMTWLMSDIFGITDTYIAAAYESAGTLIIMVIILVPMNTVVYRKRQKEIKTLSDGIKNLANGDFTVKIPINKKDALAQVYVNFNKMCEELKSVQLLRNDFVNNYSHELKTPIASINGFASLLLEKELSEAERREYLQIIVDETARLTKLASNTILLSKLSSQQIVSDTEPYDLSKQIRQCSIILSQRWLEKDIDFSCELAPTVFTGNKELMQHLWLNILSNAVEHTPKGGKISVGLLVRENRAVVKITDSGAGMSKNIQKHLFEPYFQGDASHSKKGLGLGLPIAKRVVELCGGTIEVASRISAGSTFKIMLPLN